MFKKLINKFTVHILAKRIQKTITGVVSSRQDNKLPKKAYDHYLRNVRDGLNNNSRNKGSIKMYNLISKLLVNPSCMPPKQAGKLASKYFKMLPPDDSITSDMKTLKRRTKTFNKFRSAVVQALHSKQFGLISTKDYNRLMTSFIKSVPMHEFTNINSVHKLLVILKNNPNYITPWEANAELKSLLNDPSKWKHIN